jgi:hypothetical protein
MDYFPLNQCKHKEIGDIPYVGPKIIENTVAHSPNGKLIKKHLYLKNGRSYP